MTQLTVEELTKLAKLKTEKVTQDPLKSQVRKYIQECGITDGPTPVPVFIIYHHYKRVWDNTSQKLSKSGFFREFSKIFTPKRKTKFRYYLLNSDGFDLSKEAYDQAEKYDKTYTTSRRKSKRQGEISGTGQESQLTDQTGLSRS